MTRPFVCILIGILIALCFDRSYAQTPRKLPSSLTVGPSAGFSLRAGESSYRGHLAREIVRQSVLLAAREELKLLTSDFWFAEPTGGAVLDIACSEGELNLLELLAGQAPMQERLSEKTFGLPDKLAYSQLLTVAEAHSREFYPAELAKHAVRAKRPAQLKEPPLQEWIPQMSRLGLIPLFSALRAAHALPDDQANRAIKYEALVRTYAQLGLVIDTYFAPQEAVCKARALLYAQRWVVLEPKSPRARQCRAFAWAAAGQPGQALTDLAAAEPLQAAAGAPVRPAWMPILADYCRYQVEALLRTPHLGTHGELSRLLAVIAASASGDKRRAKTILMQAGNEIGTLSRIFEQQYEVDEEDADPEPYARAAEVFANRLMDDLARGAALPQSVRKIVERGLAERPAAGSAEDYTLRAEVVAALREADAAERQAGIQREPAWSALARMIQEASFLHAQQLDARDRRLDSAAGDALWKLVEGHQFQMFLARATNHRFPAEDQLAYAVAEARRRLATLDYDSITWRSRDIFRNVKTIDQRIHDECVAAADLHRDDATLDLLSRLPGEADQQRVIISHDILAIDPFNPAARTLLVWHDWATISPKAKEWLASGSEHPPLAAALAMRMRKDASPEETESLLRAAAISSTELAPWRALAMFYEERGNRERWQATIDDFLSRNVSANDRLETLCQVAQILQSRRQWEKAEKYALLAAEMKQPRGLLAAAEVAEANQDWAKAEALYREASEAAPEHRCEWYFFCRRVGQGRESDAKELALKTIAEYDAPPRHVERPDLADFMRPGYFYVLSGDRAKAIDFFRREYNRSRSPVAGLYIALGLEEYRHKEECDRVLENIQHDAAREKNKSLAAFFELADVIRKDRAAGGQGELKLEPLLRISDPLTVEDRTHFQFLAGFYLTQRHKQVNMPFLMTAMTSPYVRHGARSLAGAILTFAGKKPDLYREALLNGIKPPPKPMPMPMPK